MPSRHRDADIPQTLVGISFSDVFRAQEFLTAATRLATLGSLKIADAIILVKDANGKTAVHETVDPQPARTALSGAMWTGLLGLILAGPIGFIAGGALGAGTGAVAAKLIDLGIPDEWVDWFEQSVAPSTATVALLVTELDQSALVAEVSRFTGHLVYANLPEDTQARLRTALGEIAVTPSVEPAVEPPEGSNTLSP